MSNAALISPDRIMQFGIALCTASMREAGFSGVRVDPLHRPYSMAVGIR